MGAILIILIVFALIFGIWYISVSNKLNRSIVKIDESLSGIDVALTKRYDVLTKMIDVVKSYAKHEKETLYEVIKLRDNMTIKEKSEANSKMDENFQKINIVAENYPELKASENFTNLTDELAGTENRIATARRDYNSVVEDFNKTIKSFPNNLLAGMFGFSEKDYFKAQEGASEAPAVQFNSTN